MKTEREIQADIDQLIGEATRLKKERKSTTRATNRIASLKTCINYINEMSEERIRKQLSKLDEKIQRIYDGFNDFVIHRAKEFPDIEKGNLRAIYNKISEMSKLNRHHANLEYILN